jgi:hypothetical protein
MSSLKLVTALGIMAVAVGCTGSVESSAPAGGNAEIAAQIDDFRIALEDLDDKARAADMQAYQALYDARRQTLDVMISERLLTLEAEARDMTKEDLINQEVELKVQPPTTEQIEAFYNQNKASVRNQPLETVSGQIQSFLTNQSRQLAMQGLLASIKAKHDVRISLDPPRVPVTVAANDPSKGPDGAPIQILEFSDFQ